jgi:site-specific DNA-methyltransferase (adenine-specific)
LFSECDFDAAEETEATAGVESEGSEVILTLPKPDYERGDVRLFLADCLDVLPLIEPGGVDAVVVDIPYGKVNRQSGGLRSLDKGAADVETFDIFDVVRECSRLADSVYVWCGTEQVSDLRAGFVAAGMTTRLCGWEKTNPSPMNGERLWLSSFECCIFARKANAWFGRHCASPIFRGPIEREQEHPTQKPLWLIEILVRASVHPDGGCLDFCMGSGTTGVACIRTGRAFIGIEKEPKYFEIAVKRCDEAFDALALIDPTPKAVRRQMELLG